MSFNQSEEEKETALESLSIEDLCLDFTWPGYSNIQLRKGGKDDMVTAANIDEYLQVCYMTFFDKCTQYHLSSFNHLSCFTVVVSLGFP